MFLISIMIMMHLLIGRFFLCYVMFIYPFSFSLCSFGYSIDVMITSKSFLVLKLLNYRFVLFLISACGRNFWWDEISVLYPLWPCHDHDHVSF
ncbi:hypothetical protein DFH27DRAFT_325871 [Peziza echinospora]|nr:hypothetical protein DFH27DRAFT_325871 [Peziza echinospora]